MRGKRQCRATDSAPPPTTAVDEQQAIVRARSVIATIPEPKLQLLRIMHGPSAEVAIAEAWERLQSQRPGRS